MTLGTNYLHYEFDLADGDVVEVVLDNQANVRLLDDMNFAKYRDGQQYRYHGGFVQKSPARMPAPRAGHWHLVVDLGGHTGTVQASARVLQGVS